MQIFTAITVAFIIAIWVFRYTVAIYLAIRGLETAYKTVGINWVFWTDLAFRKKLFCAPEGILAINDSVLVAAAKEQLLRCRARMKMVIIVSVVMGFVGFILVILAGLVDMYYSK